MAVEEEARGRRLLETSDAPSPLDALAGLVRVRRDEPPRRFEVPSAVLVMVVVDIEVGGREREGAVSVLSADVGWTSQ